MSDQKNIEKLLTEIPEMELPRGYDERFYAKVEREEQSSIAYFFKNFTLASLPTNFSMAAALGSVLLITFSILKSRNTNDPINEFAVNDEIDMLDDLEILEQWDDKEENV